MAHSARRQADNLNLAFCRQVLRSCGSFNLRKASRAVTQLYDDILQPTGLRSTQVVVLVALAAEPELNMARLARELVLSPSTLSRTIRPLEREGFLEAYSGKRGKSVRLTKRGEKALLAAVPYWQKAQAKFTGMVGAVAWEELTEQLTKTVVATRS
jgi:DNA-binding MarR family transcriptional regulator